MTTDLRGRTALVTGSTSGIGLGIARALAAAGADVVLNGIADADTVAGIEAELQSLGVKTLYDGADLRDPAQIERMVDNAVAAFGRIDILVNNAGIQHVANVEDFPVAKWDDILAVNLSSAFHTVRLLLPAMKAAGWGRIVNVASAHGLVASVQKVAYVSAKHGVLGLTKTVALEVATTGVTINAVCPGWVLTPLVQAQVDARAAAAGVSVDEMKTTMLSEKQPSREFVTPEQVAAVTLFLCSDDASQVQGAAWNVDGGWLAQ